MTTGLRIGSVIDRYEIVKHVARGGMGTVWLARFAGKHGFSKQVALKTIAPEFAQNPHSTAMFLEEARISSKLAHANVAQVLDVGEHGEGVYIVFEWVEGRSLEEICRAATAAGERVPVAFALRVLADACAGLHAAHELAGDDGEPLDVVHRDVTPSNILVSENGFAKVIDFGIAKGRDRVLAETRGGFVKGTPQYMSPEQAFKEPVDRRSDIWSLGAVLYRSLSSGPPFPDHAALLAYVDGLSLLPELPRDVSADVLAIIARALTVRAKDRFATAEEMRRAIERALHGGAADSPLVEGDEASPRIVTTKREKSVPIRAADGTAQPLAGSARATPQPATGSATEVRPPPAPEPLPSTLLSAAARPSPTAAKPPAPPTRTWPRGSVLLVLMTLAALLGIAAMLLRR
jgi:serine/threonine-protein kinase